MELTLEDVLDELQLELESGPDLIEEEESYQKLQYVAEDFFGLLDHIHAEKAVNRTLANTLESIAPDTLPEEYPLEGFTEALTKTNLDITLESMLAKGKQLIANIAKSIVKFINKILDWFKRLFGGRSKKLEAAGEAKEQAVQVIESTDKVTAKLSRESKKEIEAKRKIQPKRDGKISALTGEMIEGGKCKDALRKHGSKFLTYLVVTEKRVELLADVLKQIPRREEELDANGGLKRRTILSQLASIYNGDDVVNAEELKEELGLLLSEVRKLGSEGYRKQVNPDILHRWMDSKEFNPSEEFLASAQKVTAKIHALQKRVGDLEKYGARIEDRQVSSAVISAFSSIRDMFNAYASFGFSLGLATSAMNTGVKLLRDYASNYIELTREAVKESGNEEDRKLLNASIQEMKSRAKGLK